MSFRLSPRTIRAGGRSGDAAGPGWSAGQAAIDGTPFEVTYHSTGVGCGPAKVMFNGIDLPFTRGANPYRTGAARISLEEIRKHLTADVNRLEVYLG